MKIAIILRGQPRFVVEGAKLYNMFLKTRHSDHVEFKVFGHTWNNVSQRMVDEDEDSRVLNREVGREIDVNTIARELHKWEPETFSIQDEKECAAIAKDIISTRIATEKTTNKWLREYFSSHGVDKDSPLYDLLFTMLPEGLEMDNHLTASDVIYNLKGDKKNLLYNMKFEHLRYTYLLGQMYSAGRSFGQLEKYVAKNPDYKPDVVISLRYDAFLWFHNIDEFLLELNTANGICPTVFTRRVTVSDGLPVVDDFAFMSTYTGMEKFVGNIKDRLFETFTQSPIRLFNLLGSGSRVQHLLWTKIADPDVNIIQPTNQHWDIAVLRPGHADIENAVPSFQYFTKLKTEQDNYDYPDAAAPLTVEELDIQWNKLYGK